MHKGRECFPIVYTGLLSCKAVFRAAKRIRAQASTSRRVAVYNLQGEECIFAILKYIPIYVRELRGTGAIRSLSFLIPQFSLISIKSCRLMLRVYSRGVCSIVVHHDRREQREGDIANLYNIIIIIMIAAASTLSDGT